MTTGRINQVARLKREPARQLQHLPKWAGLRRTQAENRCSYDRRGIPHVRNHASDTSFLTFIIPTPVRTIRFACQTSNTTNGIHLAMIRTGDLPKSAWQSHAELALGTASVRAGKNPSDSSKAIRPRTYTRISPSFRLPKRQKNVRKASKYQSRGNFATHNRVELHRQPITSIPAPTN